MSVIIFSWVLLLSEAPEVDCVFLGPDPKMLSDAASSAESSKVAGLENIIYVRGFPSYRSLYDKCTTPYTLDHRAEATNT